MKKNSKLLFYLEPHPIRGGFLSFNNIFSFFSNFFIKDTIFNLKVLIDKKAHDYLKSKYPDLKNCLLPSNKHQKFIDSQLSTKKWGIEEISTWRDLMVGKGIAEQYLSIIEDTYQKWPFDCIIYWGTNGAVRQFGKKYNIPTIAMELGCTRSPHLESVVFDPIGVNGNSIHSQMDFNTLKKSIELSGILDGHFSRVECSDHNLKLMISRHLSNWTEKLLSKKLSASQTVLIPLQLHDDANLLIFSKYASMLDFLKDILPPLHNNNCFIIVKEHPSAYTRPGGKKISDEIGTYLSQFNNIEWIPADKRVENLELIHFSDVIVTVNSSLGFEASLYRKPVIIMGEASYKIKDIFPSFEEYFLDKNFNIDAYREKLFYLEMYFFNAVLYPVKEAFIPKNLFAIINAILESYNSCNGNLALFGSMILKANSKINFSTSINISEMTITEPFIKRQLKKLKHFLWKKYPRLAIFLKPHYSILRLLYTRMIHLSRKYSLKMRNFTKILSR